MTDIGQHHDPRYVPGDYEREEFADPDAGIVIVYKLFSPGTPVVAASAHCVTRSTGYEQWQLWSPERLDRGGMAGAACGEGGVSDATDLDLDLSELRDIVHGDELVQVGSSYPPPAEDLYWGEDETTQPYSVPALLAALEGK